MQVITNEKWLASVSGGDMIDSYEEGGSSSLGGGGGSAESCTAASYNSDVAQANGETPAQVAAVNIQTASDAHWNNTVAPAVASYTSAVQDCMATNNPAYDTESQASSLFCLVAPLFTKNR
jgi:hypothetical protein